MADVFGALLGIALFVGLLVGVPACVAVGSCADRCAAKGRDYRCTPFIQCVCTRELPKCAPGQRGDCLP